MEREYTYKVYVTDAIKNFLQVKVRYADLVFNSIRSEDRSPEEIIFNVRSKIKELGQ